jgi:hypothetical protein
MTELRPRAMSVDWEEISMEGMGRKSQKVTGLCDGLLNRADAVCTWFPHVRTPSPWRHRTPRRIDTFIRACADAGA